MMTSDSEEEVLFNLSNGKQYIALQDLTKSRKSQIEQPRDASTLSVFANLFKCYTGAGILGLPFAFRYSGVAAGIICLIFVSFMCTFSMVCLVRCKNALSQHSSCHSNLSYSDVVLILLGRRFSIILDITVIAFQFGAVIIYFVFVSENITPYFTKLSDVEARWCWMLFVSPVYIGLSWLRSLKYIGVISFIAEVSIIAGLVASSTIGIIQMSRDVIPGLAFQVEISPPWKTLALMFGMAAFAFEGAGVVIPTESSMKKPQNFNKVLVFVLVCATVMYICFGVLMYCAFGDETGKSTGQITENIAQFADHMPNKTFWHFIQLLIRFSLVLGIGLSVSVQLIVVIDIFEKELFKAGRLSPNNMYWKQNLIRAFITLLGLALAATGLSFGHMISLTGAFSGTLIQFIFPVACYLKCFSSEMSKGERCFMYILGISGALFGVLATYVTLVEIFS